MSKKLEGYINEATKNIREDRALASKLLTDLITSIGGQSDHQSVGIIAAKYLETLQRSNEQLVKITSIVNRDSGSKNEISSSLKDEIYDIIKGDDQSKDD